MPSLARRLARRHLPHRVRRAGLVLAGRERPVPVASPPAPPRAPSPPVPPPAPPAVVPPTPAPSAPPALMLDGVLAREGTLAGAVVAETRHLLAGGRADVAVALGTSLVADPVTGEEGALALGVVAAAREGHALAWSWLRDLPVEVWSAHAAREWVRSGLDQEPAETLRRITGLAGQRAAAVPARAWLELLGPVFGRGEHELARRLFAVLDERVGEGQDVPTELVVQRDWLRRWVSADPSGVTAPPVPGGSVSFAIMAYDHPGRSRASANIGDHVQSLASLGHLARHQQLGYDGPPDLVELMERLRDRVRPELATSAVSARVQLLQIDRDASSYAAVPPRTWTLAFGWYMHAIFETRYGLPFHPEVLPIFVSFHCSKRELLSEAAVEHLRRFAPIGCRDWTTVDVLLSVGVPAFFSGCLTTTVRTVFPDATEPLSDDAEVAYVDVPESDVPAGAPTYAHSDDAIRFRSFAANVTDAVALLETYRRHRGLVTSRLHCYLPGRSIGVPVDFRPRNRSDPRFAGLVDITDGELARMQTTLDDRLERVLGAALSGAEPTEVYALWRELNADDVAAAERRRHADVPLPDARADLVGQASRVRARLAPAGPEELTVAVAVPVGQAGAAGTLVASVAAHTGSPVRFLLLSRQPAALDVGAVAARAPGHRVELVDTRRMGNDLRLAGRKPRPVELDLLLLPELVPDCGRVLVLPAEAVVTADIAELARLDLGGRLLAAPVPAGGSAASGFGVLNRAANRLGDQTAAATELRRRCYARHRFDFDAFDPSVLVLDVASWRAGDVLGTFQPWLEEFGLGYRELLHAVVGPDRALVPGHWHAVPGRSVTAGAALLHWAEEPRPWTADVAPERGRWLTARTRPAGSPAATLPR